MSQTQGILLLASFNQHNFAGALKKEIKNCTVTTCDYGQLIPYLLQPQLKNEDFDTCIVWLTVKDIEDSLTGEINLVEHVKKLEQSFQYNIIILPYMQDNVYNQFSEKKIQTEIFRIQYELAVKCKDFALLSTESWMTSSGSAETSAPYWYLSKTPFHNNVFRQAAIACKWTLEGWRGNGKKVLILDLDDTLWGGIVGDDGWENLKLGGHDAIGEAFYDFQREIKKLSDQGIILCICSKNDEWVAMEAIEKLGSMVLKKSDFAKWRINWNDKAENIAQIIEELNVGRDSVVFLDDSPAERNRVKTALPEIMVPDLPENKMLYPAFIRSLLCFNKPLVSTEDRERNQMYRAEEERSGYKKNFASKEEWITSLKLEVDIQPLRKETLSRAHQLLNKTNQMNLRTRRLSAEELESWVTKPNHWFYTVQVKDIFGDYGITGLIGLRKNGEVLVVEDLVMSCRVMGRDVELHMWSFITQKKEETQTNLIDITCLPTEKNKPMQEFVTKLQGV